MNSRELRSRISGLLIEQQNIATKGFTPESRAQFDKIQKDVDQLEADAQRMEAYEARNTRLSSFERSPRPGVGTGTHRSADEQRSRANKAFRTYARTGQVPEEFRDVLTTSDVTGGALVPQMFNGVLYDAAKFYGAIATRVDKRETDNNGAPMKFSFSNDTSNSLTLLATEGTSSPTETDPSFFSKIVGVDTVTGGLIKVSFQELDDSSFDLDSAIRRWFGIRYARGLEKAITVGTDGAGTVLPNQPTGGLLNQAAVGVTTATLAAGISWNNLVSLYGSLDPAYSGPDAAWVFNASTRSYLLAQVDGFGRPFWTPDPTSDSPFGKLLGYDVVINQAMPNQGVANATPIMFGDLKKAYLLRTDGQPSILRLNERYADTLEIGFFLYSRIGGVSLNAGVNPIVKLQQAAS